MDRGNHAILTPALTPPPTSSLTTRGNPFFKRVLQALSSGRAHSGYTDGRNPAPPSYRRYGISGVLQTVCSTSTRTGGVCRPELPPENQLLQAVLAASPQCLQIDNQHSGRITAGDVNTTIYHSEASGHPPTVCEPSKPHKQQYEPVSLDPGHKRCLKQAILSSNETRTLKLHTKPKQGLMMGNLCNRNTSTRNTEGNPAVRKHATNGGKASGSGEGIASKELDSISPDTLHALRHVGRMGAEELEGLASLLARAEEVAMALLFSDHSTQLRDIQSKKGCLRNSTEIEGVCLAFPVRGGAVKTPVLQYAFLPLDPANGTVDSWCRTQLLQLLSNTRVICYDGQELLSTLVSHFEMEDSRAWLGWRPLDTRVGGWLLDPDHPPESFPQLLVRVGMQPTARSMEKDTSGILICKDLALLGPLMVSLYQKLQDKGLWSLFAELEVKLIPILAAMEVTGIHVNCEKLLQYAELLKAKIAKVETSAHKAAGHAFSINSTVQLRQVLFDELRLDEKCSRKLSKTHVQRQKSTSEAVLTQLRGLHPLPALVLEYRQLCKMNTTYISGILPYISSKGILRPYWQHTGTATGRLVSCNPNIQAFPKQPINLGTMKEQYVVGKQAEEVQIDIRKAVESKAGFSFLAADFKSIELRLLAHLSGDPTLIGMLTSQQSSDVFTLLASEWLNLDLEEVKPNDREKAKRVVYAVVYGVGKEKLAEMLNVHPSYAKNLMSSFLTRFPQVEVFIQKTVAECREKEFLTTICGRKRWFPHINSANLQLKSHCERQAVNFPVQGSAADICKSAMIKVLQMLAVESPQSRLLLQIHDELLFEVPDPEIRNIAGKVRAVLESTTLLSCALKVPLEVRVTSGKNWSALTPV